jgi:hypothetical protein
VSGNDSPIQFNQYAYCQQPKARAHRQRIFSKKRKVARQIISLFRWILSVFAGAFAVPLAESRLSSLLVQDAVFFSFNFEMRGSSEVTGRVTGKTIRMTAIEAG